MKIVIPPRITYLSTIDTKTYKETYFGNLESSTADVEVLTEWNPLKLDYSYLNEVVIGVLNTKYTATTNNPVGHPSTSSGWFREGINQNQMTDSLYTSQTVFSGECESIFDITYMTHVIGQNLTNVKEIKMIFVRADGTEISTVFDCDTCVLPETKIVMGYYESFDCDACDNPEISIKTNFFLRLTENTSTDAVKVKIVMTKIDISQPILIGVMAVGRAYSLGCSQSGMTLELTLPNNTTSFPAIGQTGLSPANIETSMRGNTLIDRRDVDKLRALLSKHGAYLNFYLFDELDEIVSGVVLGRFTRISMPITTANKV